MYYLKTDRDSVRWELRGRALILGRGEACDIRVTDPLVSRLHCKVWISGDRVHVQDLNSSNTTLVNGEPSKKTVLESGDVLTVGSLVLELVEEPEQSRDGNPQDVTVGLEQSLKSYDSGSSFALDAAPTNTSELRALFLFGKSLSQSETTKGLLDRLRETLITHFNPDAAWLAIASGPCVLCVEPLISEYALDGIEVLVRRILFEPKAALMPRLLPDQNQRRLETTILTPVSIGSDVMAILIVRSHSRRRVFDVHDLSFAMVLANTFAPYFAALQRSEQLSRDYSQLRINSNVAEKLVGESPSFLNAVATAELVADTDLNVLLLGETGSGKELVARMLHDHSSRQRRPFIVVNCAAIPSELFESEIFGVEAGAFTGAKGKRIGRLEEAHGGTLVLDEVGDLSPEHQARLLRAIESGVFQRIGSSIDVKVDVRIVAATNRPIHAMLQGGKFREDLYHRLAQFELLLPALRERADDIPLLAKHFLSICSSRKNFGPLHFSPIAMSQLCAHTWPGNVRELKSTIERAAVLARGEVILPEHLRVLPSASSLTTSSPEHPKPVPLREMEQEHINKALEYCGGNMRATARILGISRSTLYRKIEGTDE